MLTNIFESNRHALFRNLHMKLGLQKIACKVAVKETVKQLICFCCIKIVFGAEGQALGSWGKKKELQRRNSDAFRWSFGIHTLISLMTSYCQAADDKLVGEIKVCSTVEVFRLNLTPLKQVQSSQSPSVLRWPTLLGTKKFC
ncbi:hypothetical protein E3U43_020241 [Larimichthys crocea]|uniref:Uncharacterized protein n=1 Tax=Larimichthys crocea TaxID=215358 RepID=A0ACD3QVT7_LARCR|nr:hypothetical protein E3U43_020241 [Larimichthys crocea]